MNHSQREELDDSGYLMLGGAASAGSVASFSRLIDSVPDTDWERRGSGTPFAIRNAHLKIDGLLSAVRSAGLLQVAEELLDDTPRLVSATVFDKPQGAKWAVPGHQDVVHPVEGERPEWADTWSVRDGVAHARIPEEVLAQMLSLRVHCDDCAEQGALEVLPLSHGSGLTSHQISELPIGDFVPCPAIRGDVLAMRPQLIHRSVRSGEGERRRVLHLTFSGCELPDGVRWTWDG